MTHFPDYLKTYPNMHSSSPLHLSVNRLCQGFRAHRHDYLEFSFVIEGSGSERINGVHHPMGPGTFTFILPYQIHEITTDPGQTLVLYNCEFSMDLLMEARPNHDFASLLNAPSSLQAYTEFERVDMERMHTLIADMFEEYKGSEPWRDTLLQAKLKEILVRFDRRRRKNKTMQISSPYISRVGLSAWPIIHYINNNYQENLTLGDLATLFAMSLSRISEVIKQATGQNFVHYLHDLRLRHACSLLVSTEMSVIEIALEVGYGSYKTFSHIFRESKGIAPKDYRKLKTSG